MGNTICLKCTFKLYIIIYIQCKNQVKGFCFPVKWLILTSCFNSFEMFCYCLGFVVVVAFFYKDLVKFKKSQLPDRAFKDPKILYRSLSGNEYTVSKKMGEGKAFNITYYQNNLENTTANQVWEMCGKLPQHLCPHHTWVCPFPLSSDSQCTMATECFTINTFMP